MHKLHFLIAATWLWLRRDLHNFDFTREPESQKRFRRWIVRGIHSMEYDPHTQWRYHLAMVWFWLVTITPILVLFFGFEHQWIRWGVFITLIYSLYANWATDFGALHAAWAAFRGDQIMTEQQEREQQLEDIQDVLADAQQRELAAVRAALRSIQEAIKIKRQTGTPILPETLAVITHLEAQERSLTQEVNALGHDL